MAAHPDSSLDALLCLDGEIFFIDPSGGHWVKFEVKRTEVSQARPHGLRYSLTLHDKDGTRLVGSQCAFGHVGIRPRGKRAAEFDHKHRLRTIKPYDYADAASLLADFWSEVEAVLATKGVIL